MTDLHTAAKQALEALEKALRYHGVMLLSDPPQDAWKFHRVEQTAHEAITAVCQALAEQPAQQEPFGHVTVRRLSQRFENHADQYHFYPAGQSPYLDNVDECHAVYTRPQAREPLMGGDDRRHIICLCPDCTKPARELVGLTDAEIRDWWRIENGLEDCNMAKLVDFTLAVRAIEAKLKEKNT